MLLSIAEKTDTFAQFITVLVIFAFVLFLTAAVTKWIAGYQKTQNKNRNIEVIETSRMTSNKYIQIVRVGEKYLAIAVCKDTVTMLAEVSKEQLELSVTEGEPTMGFKDFLEKAKQIHSGKNQGPKEEK